MFDILTEDTFYDFPSFKKALISFLLAFVLSSVIAFTYHFTDRKTAFSRNFYQSLVLSSLVSCMVIMAVGNNLAAGFGVIGAIAIIRFRMRIENPRNIIFIFASLSVGIATGVYGYSIALAGTIAFCSIALILYFSPFGAKNLSREYRLAFTLLNEGDKAAIEKILDEQSQDLRLLRISNGKRGDRFEYFITLKSHIDKDDFFQGLKAAEGVDNLRLDRSDNLDQL